VTAPAWCHQAYCDNYRRMQKARMCSRATLLKRYSAKTMCDCSESFLPSIFNDAGSARLRPRLKDLRRSRRNHTSRQRRKRYGLSLSVLAGFCSCVTDPYRACQKFVKRLAILESRWELSQRTALEFRCPHPFSGS
jgi:hypothetical protein